jgi:hypothetical protein
MGKFQAQAIKFQIKGEFLFFGIWNLDLGFEPKASGCIPGPLLPSPSWGAGG